MKKILIFGIILCSLSSSFAQSFEKFVSDLERTGAAKRGALVKQYLATVKSTPIIEGKGKVHFVWFGKADTVRVEGELQTSWAIPQMMTRVECGGENLF